MRLYFIFVCLIAGITGLAQTSGVSGKLIDSASKNPVALATIAVFNAQDTTLLSYRMSNDDGRFKIGNLPNGIRLTVIISFSGLRVQRLSVDLLPGVQKDLGTISMTPDAKTLDEMLVYAERPPVIVKKDTIEFNAAAFKTLPTALVEDLLRKLPGVLIDKDGNIVVNGRKVNRLLVDGKDFFGSDHRMATRNLPANIIDKIQVTDDKNEAELNPDKALADLGQVVNLKLKRAIKKGWFGKAYAGAGSSGLHEAGSIINLFKDTLQVSLLAFTNNLDRAGFGISDIQTLGGFDRGGLDDYVINGRGLNVNNMSFGGQGEGINTSTGAGVNANHVLKNGLTVNTQYFYGKSANDINEMSERRQYTGDSVFTTRLQRSELVETFNHRLALGIKGNINPSTRFEFKPTLVLRELESKGIRSFENSNNFSGALNQSTNHQQINGLNTNYDHSFIFIKSFPKKGRSVNLSNSLYFGEGKNDQSNLSDTHYYFPTDIDSMADQLRQRNSGEFNMVLNVNWNEPLTKRFVFRLNYSVNYQKSYDKLYTFNKDHQSGKYEDMNADFTNDIKRSSWRNQLSPSLTYSLKKFTATLNLNILSWQLHNSFGKQIADLRQDYRYVLPAINLRLGNLSLAYSSGVSVASLSDLQPVPDNSNPLYINFGNPALEPTFTNSIRFNYTKNSVQKMQYFRAGVVGNFRDNAIVRTRSLTMGGVQETRPLNIDGVLSVNPTLDFSKQYKLTKNVQLIYNLGTMIGWNKSRLVLNEKRSNFETINLFPYTNASLNVADKFEWNIGYSHRFAKTSYKEATYRDLNVSSSVISGEFIVRACKHFVLETQADRKYNNQVSAGIQNSSLLWNAAITWMFLRNDNGLLKLSAYDLLKQNTNVTRSVAENFIMDRAINMLTQYFLLTFTYNIRDFKQGKIGGRQKFFLF